MSKMVRNTSYHIGMIKALKVSTTQTEQRNFNKIRIMKSCKIVAVALMGLPGLSMYYVFNGLYLVSFNLIFSNNYTNLRLILIQL